MIGSRRVRPQCRAGRGMKGNAGMWRRETKGDWRADAGRRPVRRRSVQRTQLTADELKPNWRQTIRNDYTYISSNLHKQATMAANHRLAPQCTTYQLPGEVRPSTWLCNATNVPNHADNQSPTTIRSKCN